VIHLNYRDSRPIYEQVRDGLRQLLMSGAISPGEKLPSVRALAAKLTINPNTIQRAYEALEKEGYVYTQLGKGTFAAQLSDVNAERRRELLAQFEQTAAELLFLGTPTEQLIERLREVEEKLK
jgi:GntR family transcriptional regulator